MQLTEAKRPTSEIDAGYLSSWDNFTNKYGFNIYSLDGETFEITKIPDNAIHDLVAGVFFDIVEFCTDPGHGQCDVELSILYEDYDKAVDPLDISILLPISTHADDALVLSGNFGYMVDEFLEVCTSSYHGVTPETKDEFSGIVLSRLRELEKSIANVASSIQSKIRQIENF